MEAHDPGPVYCDICPQGCVISALSNVTRKRTESAEASCSLRPGSRRTNRFLLQEFVMIMGCCFNISAIYESGHCG